MPLLDNPLSLIGGFAFNFIVNIIISTIYVDRRKKFALRVSICFILYFIIFFIWPNEEFLMNNMIIGFFTYYFFLPFLLGIIILIVCYKLSFLEGLFFALCAWFGENFVSGLSGDIVLLCGLQVRSVEHMIIRIALMAFYCFIYYLVVVYKSKYKKTIKVNNIATVVVAILGVTILTVLAQLKSAYPELKQKTVNIIVYSYSSMFSLFTLAYMNGLFQNEILKENVGTLETALKKQAEIYELNQENIDYINIKLHDLSKEISLINKSKLEEKDKDIIDSVSKRIKIYSNIPRTGNEAIDTIIASKSLLLEKEQIRFTCIVDGKLLDFMPSIDIFSLIGNAMDNAIEAELKENKDQRLISMRLYKEDNSVFFEMQNYCSHINELDENLKTSKKDKKYHGYGIKGMRYITQKYHGTFDIEKTEELFCVFISIPLNQK